MGHFYIKTLTPAWDINDQLSLSHFGYLPRLQRRRPHTEISCPSLRALCVCRRWAGNSLRAGTNSCAEREQAHEWCMQCDMRVAHTCSRLSSVLAVLCTAFFFLRTVPLPPVRTCRAHSAGARTAQCGAAWARAVRGRFESGRAPACAPMGRAQMRGRAGALLAGVHGAGTTMRGRNERAGSRAPR